LKSGHTIEECWKEGGGKAGQGPKQKAAKAKKKAVTGGGDGKKLLPAKLATIEDDSVQAFTLSRPELPEVKSWCHYRIYDSGASVSLPEVIVLDFLDCRGLGLEKLLSISTSGYCFLLSFGCLLSRSFSGFSTTLLPAFLERVTGFQAYRICSRTIDR
jgi:hypothetical protein